MKWNKYPDVKPPEKRATYLTFDGEAIVCLYWYSARRPLSKSPISEWNWHDDGCCRMSGRDEITHWMELPEAPKD